jgi:hypothetical protein
MNLHPNILAPESGAPSPDSRSGSSAGDGLSLHQRLDALVRELCPDAPSPGIDGPQRIAALLEDTAWNCEPAVRAGLAAVLARLAQPAGQPIDALPSDPSWPRLWREVEAHDDFLRLRDVESNLRHAEVGTFPFERHDWEHAREEECALREHHRQVRETSYAPAQPAVFRVH